MTIGSLANLTFAFGAIRDSSQPNPLSPVERLALILIYDGLGMGAGEISIRQMHSHLGTDDPSEAESTLISLARRGLVRMTTIEGGAAFVATAIADEGEIENVREHDGCRRPFHNWTGTP